MSNARPFIDLDANDPPVNTVPGARSVNEDFVLQAGDPAVTSVPYYRVSPVARKWSEKDID